MRLVDLIRPYEDGLVKIVAETPEGIDVRRHVFLSDGVSFERSAPGSAARTPRGTITITMLGPDPQVHGDPAAAASLLARLDTGARAIILFGWQPTELPYHRILDALTRHRCQVLQVAAVDDPIVVTAAMVERVDELLPPRSALGEPTTAAAAADLDKLAIELRMANELAFGESVARALRATLRDPEGADRRRLDAYRGEAAQLIKDRDVRISTLEKRVEALESSTSYRLGGTLVRATRSPSALVRVPIDVWRIWRGRGP